MRLRFSQKKCCHSTILIARTGFRIVNFCWTFMEIYGYIFLAICITETRVDILLTADCIIMLDVPISDKKKHENIRTGWLSSYLIKLLIFCWKLTEKLIMSSMIMIMFNLRKIFKIFRWTNFLDVVVVVKKKFVKMHKQQFLFTFHPIVCALYRVKFECIGTLIKSLIAIGIICGIGLEKSDLLGGTSLAAKCFARCASNFCWLVNDFFRQMSHSNKLFPCTFAMCFFRLPSVVNRLEHISHWNFLSAMWLLMWTLRPRAVENIFPQNLQLPSLSPMKRNEKR